MGALMDHHLTEAIYSIHSQAKIFCEIGQVLTSSLNPKEVFKRVMKLIGEYFSPRNWSLLLMEENTGRLKFEIVMGVDADKLKKFYIPKGEGIAGWVCQHCQPAVVQDVSKDSRFSPIVDQLLGFVTRSVVCVPLLNGKNRVIGAIELINKIAPAPDGADPEAPPVFIDTKDEPFTILDMEILAAIGAFTGIAAENAFLHQKVKELAMIDPLTRIYNRHYFNDVMQREKKRIKRFGYSICILMMDVDGLKSINDRYGHMTGDKVLTDIARILKSSIRESDVLARFGGDEFIILMPNADAEDGYSLSSRIQQSIIRANQELSDNEPRRSLSIGIYASGSDDLNQILREADKELYQIKFFQRNYEDIISEEQMRSYIWHNILDNGE
jgi:diguanylate cyclase (GGDEF)-like protein